MNGKKLILHQKQHYIKYAKIRIHMPKHVFLTYLMAIVIQSINAIKYKIAISY